MSIQPKSYKVGVLTPGDRELVFNGLRFATRAAAERYGQDLAGRWFAIRHWEVVASTDAATD